MSDAHASEPPEVDHRRAERHRFGSNLTRLMDEKGVLPGAVADALNVSPRTVVRWRAGGAMPDEEKVLALARYLRVARTRLTEWPMLGRRHPANHSPDLVIPQDVGPFVRGYRLRVTDRQEGAVAHLAETRGITHEDALRWYLNLGVLFAAMRRTAQAHGPRGLPRRLPACPPARRDGTPRLPD